jgi:hypothetical protein
MQQHVIFEYTDGTESAPLTTEQAAPLYDCRTHSISADGMPICNQDGRIPAGMAVKQLPAVEANPTLSNPLMSPVAGDGGFPWVLVLATVGAVAFVAYNALKPKAKAKVEVPHE